ncbi:anti-sigma factor RsbA family regulatory protein [Micromonospora sp. WMMD558]|uniref:anti-sigma factor RsbA family regulatory protein n=1 Tax=Micromonospora sp. WMMD558 TaxID=3403462 RepID=UPI003BF545DA
MTGTLPAQDEFVHEGLFYRDTDALVAGLVPFVAGGLAAGEPVLVAMPRAHLDLVHDAVAEPDAVCWADMADAGRNPGRIIPWVLQAFVDRHPGRRVRIVGEPIWVGRSAAEYPACAQHEAMINRAFTGRAATILCPYDAAGLDDTALADAYATHPVLVDAAGRRSSPAYAPSDVVARYNAPLQAPAEPVDVRAYHVDTLPELRRFVASRAAVAGLAADRVADLQIAVTELAANSVAHGGGSGVLRVWTSPEHLVCEIHDGGWLSDPLAGRLTPASDGIGGRGLVIVHALCDLVRVHTTPAGTSVRLHMRRPL